MLVIDSERLPQELDLAYAIRSRLGKGKALLQWRCDGRRAATRLSAEGVFAFKHFQFEAASERIVSSGCGESPQGLVHYRESFQGREKTWSRESLPLESASAAASWVAAIELPFAFVPSARVGKGENSLKKPTEAIILAGRKPYRLSIDYPGDELADFELFGEGERKPRSRFATKLCSARPGLTRFLFRCR